MISGAALVVQRLAQGMARRGHSVMVLGASDRGLPYQETKAGVRVARLRAVPNPARIGQRFVVWPGRALADALGAFQPDVIHLHDPLQLALAGLRAARHLRVPAVLTLHAMPGLAAAYAPAVPGLRWAIQALAWTYGTWLARRCQGIVVPSRVMADLIADRNGLRAHVIGNGVDLQSFHPQGAPGEADALRARYGLSPELPVILYVGRLDVEKRADLVLRAAAGPVRAGQAQLVLSGDGRQRRGLERLAERLGIRRQTHFTGFVTAGDDLAGLYRLASAFAIASEVETQGVAVLEAAASGLPVVTVRATAMPELVEHAVSGFLAAPGDHAAMGAHLSELLAQPHRARAMGLAGREKMARSHSHALTLDQHDALYLTAGARPRAPAGALPQTARHARVSITAEGSED
jgi:glycosyltransferase involved in cell wall biosynthesis